VSVPDIVRTRYIDDHKRLAWRFNPTYGQGMSVGALDSLILRRHPRRGAEWPTAPLLRLGTGQYAEFRRMSGPRQS